MPWHAGAMKPISIAIQLLGKGLLAASLSGAAMHVSAQEPADNPPTAAATPNPQQVEAAARVGARDDSRIASAVAALLLRQPALQPVSVQVHSGVVTLGGMVPQDADRERAATLAKQVKGVVEVVNAIELDARLQTRMDAALEQVKGKFVRLLAATPLLVAAMAIVLLSMWLGRVLGKRSHRLHLRSRNPYMDGLVRRVVQSLVVLAGVLVALDLLGATALVGAVIGSAGVLGLVFGFGFKDIAENYIAGVLLSLRRPFAPGDHLVVDKYEGKVVSLTPRATLMMTLDGNQLSLPNALVFKSVVLNYSVNPKRRFDFSVPIDTAASIRAAQQTAMAQISGTQGVLPDPAPSWIVDGYAAAGIVLKFFGWVDQRESDPNKVRSEALRAVKAAFAAAKIEGPRSVQYVYTALAPDVREGAATHEVAAEPVDGGDTSVNRDIDAQLAVAQQNTDDTNLLDAPASGTREPG